MSVQSVLADPDFQKLPPQQQKQVLAGIDKDFAGLSDAQFEQVKAGLGQPAVDMSEKNYGKDTSGDGFVGHALDTFRTLQQSFNNGRLPDDIINGTMQALRHPIDTIGGVIARPFNTAMSGDIPGALGDVTDIAGQIALGRYMPSPVADAVGRTAAITPIPGVMRKGAAMAKGVVKGAANGAAEMVPISHGALPRLLGVPDVNMPASVVQGGAGAAAGHFLAGHPGEMVGGAVGAVAPIVKGAVKGGKEAARTFDFRKDLATRSPVAYADTPSVGATPGQYDAPKMTPAPVEVGGGRVPDYKYPLQGPEEFARRNAEIDAQRAVSTKVAPPPKFETVTEPRNVGGQSFDFQVPAPTATPSPSPSTVSAPPLASTAEQNLPGGQAVIPDGQMPVRQHETLSKVDRQISEKANNIAQYLRSQGADTSHLEQIMLAPDVVNTMLDGAHAYGQRMGNPVPKTGYKPGLEKGGGTHRAIIEHLQQMIEDERTKP